MTTTTLTKHKKQLRDLVLETMATIDTFAALLDHETQALKKSDFKAVDHLQTDKRNLAREYQAQVALLGERKDEMMSLDLPLREKLLKTRTKFTVTLTENTQALETMKNSAQRLIDRILEAARLSVADTTQTSYSGKGQVQSYKTSTLALSFDHKL